MKMLLWTSTLYTLEGAQLKFYCRKGLTPSNVYIAYCNKDKTWTSDPTGLTCSHPGNLPSPTARYDFTIISYSMLDCMPNLI